MTDAAEEAEETEKKAVQAYQYLCDICSWRLLNHDFPLMLGGPGVVVQIEESLFHHKPKVSSQFSCMGMLVERQSHFIVENMSCVWQ